MLLLITATVVELELQVTVSVRFCVEPSVKVPVAVNCCVVPSAMEGLAGVIAIDSRAAGVTVSVVVPLTAPEVAVMLVLPVATLVASPMVGAESLIVATFNAEEVQ